jgi:hypothetical protein
MKKLLFVFSLLLFAVNVFGQDLQKGAVIGAHVWTAFELKPGITEEQFLEFFETKYKPEYEKHFEGVKMFVLRGIKGNEEGKLGHIYYYKDQATFKKYVSPAGGLTEEGLVVWEKVQPVFDELFRMIEDWDSEFTDWKFLF